MTTVPQPLIVALAVIGVVWLIALVRKGPNEALGLATLLSFLLPRWYELDVFGFELTYRTAIAVVALAVMAVHPRGGIRANLVWPDLFVLVLTVQTAVTEVYYGGVHWQEALRAYGEWAVPYVAGRYAIRSAHEAAFLLPWACLVAIVLAVTAILNSGSGINIFDRIFGEPTDYDVLRDKKRYGFTRATGPTEHPIFFAGVMLALLPFTWSAIKHHSLPRKVIGTLAIVVLLGGLAATVSRGPILTVFVIAVVGMTYWLPMLRWGLAAVVLLGGVGGWVYQEEVVAYVAKIGDETQLNTDVELDGKRVESSSTRNRLLVIKAYWPSFVKGQFLGYGTDAIRQRPPKLPTFVAPERTREILRHIDNGYLLNGLRIGWLGVIGLIGLLLTSAWSVGRLSEDRSLFGLPAAISSTLCGFAVLLLTVFLAYEFAFELLWLCGVAGGLQTKSDAYHPA